MSCHLLALPRELKDIVYDLATSRDDSRNTVDGSTLAALICAFGTSDELTTRQATRGTMVFRHPRHLAALLFCAGDDFKTSITHIGYDIFRPLLLANIRGIAFPSVTQLPNLDHIEIGNAQPPSMRWNIDRQDITPPEQFGNVTVAMESTAQKQYEGFFDRQVYPNLLSKSRLAAMTAIMVPRDTAYRLATSELRRQKLKIRSRRPIMRK
ncbi:hypothetical protein LTR56_010506 [Elasticomyces elasticus]|nr:hypothetical protein LTR56_010506 [Elasticomyces elasticus]KAK3657922.1 hypothetical protein LTR22_009149 [Elasticomyces elasticus]KAK4917609.1 hypothetical protein LTR49_014563 [Elasticomyces elasticus]KAK5762829.1 hypothetical protein LTS12_007018 [Elasticomyces elasticus]